MDNSQPAASILDTLRTVEFRLGLKGYNVDEVDEYLEKAAVEAEAMQEQARQTNERLRQATERIAQLESQPREAPAEAPVVEREPEPAAVAAVAAADPGAVSPADDSLQRTLLMAQKFVDQARRESEAEAAEVVAQAEERAQATVAQAEERARRITAEGQQGLREEVARLEAARGQLANDVENMARHLESERQRLQKGLTDVLKWIDENVQPANALMALGPRVAGSARRSEEAGRLPAPEPAAALGETSADAGNGAAPSDPGSGAAALQGDRPSPRLT